MSSFLLDLVAAFLSCLRNGVELKEIISVVNKVLASLGIPNSELLTQREEVILAEADLIKMSNATASIGAEALRLADELKRVKEELETTKSELKEKKYQLTESQGHVRAYMERPEVPDFRCEELYTKSDHGGSNRLHAIKYLRGIMYYDYKMMKDAVETLIGIGNMVGDAAGASPNQLVDIFTDIFQILVSPVRGLGLLVEDKSSRIVFGGTKCSSGGFHSLNHSNRSCKKCGIPTMRR